MNSIVIKTKNTDLLHISELNNFQGELKKLTKNEQKKLENSIVRRGFCAPLFVWKENNYILDGHQRLVAINSLIEKGYCLKLNGEDTKSLPVIFVDAKDKKEAAELVLAYNSQYGEITKDSLLNFIESFEINYPDLHDNLALDIDIRSVFDSMDSLQDVEADNPKQIQTDIKLGDLFQLGKNRLLCGDATNEEHVKKVLGEETIDLVFTDPPYGVSYADKNKFLNAADEGNRMQKEIANDHLSVEDCGKLWFKSFENYSKFLSKQSSYYVCSPQGGDLLLTMMQTMIKSNLPLRHTLIWVKNNHVLGRCDYNYKHEPILYGWKNTHKFYGNGSQKFSTWNFDKPHSSKLHPTMKPIELICNAVLNSSQEGDVVADFFGGSGSTLIACEQTNRKCYMMEIDPVYCQVIINRWEKLTGNKAVKTNG